MTRGIEEVVGARPATQPQLRVDRVVRAGLLLVFIAAIASVWLIGHAPQRDQAFLQHEIDAGRVTSIAYDADAHLRWSEGPLTWYRTDFRRSDPAATDDPYWELSDLTRGHAVSLREVGWTRVGWLGLLASGPLIVAVGCAWLATLVLVAIRPRRFATGWAWMPMILFSVVGPPLYLLLEPGPLWRREEWPADRRPLPWWAGWLGLLVSGPFLAAFAS